jgi:uncharacterized membrane protein YgdD (TMEM256/DUF423 family)
MNRKLTITAALLIAVSIVLGAFGAHALKKVLTPDELSSFEVGVRYQMYQGLALLILGINAAKFPVGFRRNTNFMLFGLLLFSSSIYFLSIDRLMGLELKWLGPITPLGGLLMITGWVLLVVQLARKEEERNNLD